MKKVLFIASLSERYYYDAFLSPCIKEGLCVYVFDPSRIPRQAAINMTLDNSGFVLGFIDVFKCVGEDLVECRLPIQEIDIAWYLRENSNDSDHSFQEFFPVMKQQSCSSWEQASVVFW